MPGFNVPSYTTSNISIGPGVLFLAAAGNTPTVDVGAVRSGELTITREKLDVDQGFPAQPIVSYAIGEDVTLTINAIEWDFTHLAQALGSGVVTGTTQFDFGGDPNFSEVALKYQHRMAAGSTIVIDIWRANGSGELTTTFGDDVQEFPYSFTALNAVTSWDAVALGDTTSMFQIRRTD
jgi:hypothetical protein